MSLEANKQLIQRWLDVVFVQHEVDAVEQFVSPEMVNHATGRRGVEDMRAVAQAYKVAAPSLHATVEHLVAEGDLVVQHVTWTGIHEGELRFADRVIPASGRPFSFRHVHIFRVRDGLIVEHWAVRDDLTMLQQFGVMQ